MSSLNYWWRLFSAWNKRISEIYAALDNIIPAMYDYGYLSYEGRLMYLNTVHRTDRTYPIPKHLYDTHRELIEELFTIQQSEKSYTTLLRKADIYQAERQWDCQGTCLLPDSLIFSSWHKNYFPERREEFYQKHMELVDEVCSLKFMHDLLKE